MDQNNFGTNPNEACQNNFADTPTNTEKPGRPTGTVHCTVSCPHLIVIHCHRFHATPTYLLQRYDFKRHVAVGCNLNAIATKQLVQNNLRKRTVCQK